MKSNAWQQWEDDLLIESWPARKEAEVVRRTGRTLASVKQRAYNLGLRRAKTHKWIKFSGKR